MKYLSILFFFTAPFVSAQTNFSNYPIYQGNDLGLTYSPQKSIFKVWSPLVEEMILRFYDTGLDGKLVQEIPMSKTAEGVWLVEIAGDNAGKYYTFQAKFDNKWNNEVLDPYCKAVGANGKRGMILDLKTTNPKNWQQDKSPQFKSVQDAIIYELHVRDATIAASSGVKNKGKFLGLCEIGTKNDAGLSTGIDHIKALGVTHVHLLPIFDFNSVDETAEKPTYNWGYDPLNYNALEGSYSTNPYNAAVRINEFKTLVKTFHENGLSIVMDVVYNHTHTNNDSYFNQLVPNYYYRQKADGSFSNASGCGNETASERPMMQKFMLESLKYWVQEYHIDGFRFDLMGIHDIETMNLIADELRKIKPNILLYGEGWTAGDSPLPENQRSIKKHANRLHNVAVFSDDMRDGLKGSVFEHQDTGFVSGKMGMEESIKFGIVGANQHAQINYEKVNYSKQAYTSNAAQVINYSECHDNHTLWDRLNNSVPNASEEDKIKMHILANTIVLTSQGIPFIHAGTEFLRTKNGVENSFESPDGINQLDWNRKTTYQNVVSFYQKLIALRKNHAIFRMMEVQDIEKSLSFLPTTPGVVAYRLKNDSIQDTWKDVILVFNANKTPLSFNLPDGLWKPVLRGQDIHQKGLERKVKSQILVPSISGMVLIAK